MKARTQLLEDRVKREIGKRNESYTQNTKAFGLVQKFLAAAQSGFPGRAIDMVFAESDWDNVPASGLDIRLPMQIVPSLEQRFGSLFSTASIQDMKDGSVTYHTTGIGLNLQAIALQLQSGSLDKAAQQLTNAFVRVGNSCIGRHTVFRHAQKAVWQRVELVMGDIDIGCTQRAYIRLPLVL